MRACVHACVRACVRAKNSCHAFAKKIIISYDISDNRVLMPVLIETLADMTPVPYQDAGVYSVR